MKKLIFKCVIDLLNQFWKQPSDVRTAVKGSLWTEKSIKQLWIGSERKPDYRRLVEIIRSFVKEYSALKQNKLAHVFRASAISNRKRRENFYVFVSSLLPWVYPRVCVGSDGATAQPELFESDAKKSADIFLSFQNSWKLNLKKKSLLF